jgi:hypothetical protein
MWLASLDLEVVGHDLAQKMPSQFPPEKSHHVAGTNVQRGLLAMAGLAL